MLGLFNRNREPARHPTKADSFKKLIELGVPVGAVLDVGVHKCTRDLMVAFPDKHHLLFEPIAEMNSAITENYARVQISHEIINAAICDHTGPVRLKTYSIHSSQAITHAVMIGEEDGAKSTRTVDGATLDSIVSARSLPEPFLLKIDVDGAELSVLRGAAKTLDACSVVVVEAGITNMVARAQVIQNAGFTPFDIVDLCYYDGRLVQADLVFLSRKVIEARGLQVYKDGFDAAKWREYRPR